MQKVSAVCVFAKKTSVYVQKCTAISIINILSTQHFFGTCPVLSRVDNYRVRRVLRELREESFLSGGKVGDGRWEQSEVGVC